jgi:hypothetical protein
MSTCYQTNLLFWLAPDGTWISCGTGREAFDHISKAMEILGWSWDRPTTKPPHKCGIPPNECWFDSYIADEAADELFDRGYLRVVLELNCGYNALVFNGPIPPTDAQREALAHKAAFHETRIIQCTGKRVVEFLVADHDMEGHS